ncbi:MAG: efflux RND transporter permease subunit [Alphaproteobacteria bacterium]|nr:efflux RND transporter permease subunit [Alphaproteobacteria bacterium]
MRFTSYFIKHPIIALILNAMIMIIGVMCLKTIPVREYPEIKLPTLSVYTQYPNASAELVETTITNILEEKLAAIEGLEMITSQSQQDGSNIDLTFIEGTSVDRTLIAIRDAIGLARPDLPKEILEPVVQQKIKSDGPPFIAISVSSKNLGLGELTHYATLNLKNAFHSLKGVASAEVWGQPYTMAVALDPLKLYTFGTNADEVFTALKNNNLSWPVGKYRDEVPTTLDLSLSTVRNFEDLFIKDNKTSPIFLKSIASVYLKTNTKSLRTRVNGMPGVVVGISRTSDSNPLDVSNLVREQLKEMKKTLPPDMVLEIVSDQADFIRASLQKIEGSIGEAVLLVLVIVFLFLRKIRATLIPLITIPISLIGSIILLKLFGFSINTLTLLAMVLAIGLVVDDAIVVLENIDRHIRSGLSPIQAALQGSGEIGFAIIAMTLTLASVYAPIAFIPGTVGRLFIEFAVALAGSVFISGVVALTLSPLMCGYVLSLEKQRFFPQIDVYFKKLETFYCRCLQQSLTLTRPILLIAGATILVMMCLFYYLPSEVAPKEDRGLMGVYLPRIPGKDVNVLEPYVEAIEAKISEIPESKGNLAFINEWGATVIATLKPHNERHASAQILLHQLRTFTNSLPSIDAYAWSWDSGLPGLDDVVSGSELILSISSLGSYRDLFTQVERARKTIEDRKLFDFVRHNLSLDTPGYSISLDPNVVFPLGLSPSQISKMIEVFFSGNQSLRFEKDGIRYPITLEGNVKPWTLDELYLTNAKGKRISLGTLANLKPTTISSELQHYNQMRSVYLSVGLKAGQNMKAAMTHLWDLTTQSISPYLKKDWIGAAKMYTKSSMDMMLFFGMALIFIYAILAIQFESFLDPLIIMLTVPLGCFGALLTAWVFGQSLNIYTQIGLVTLVGLISKHGILIVEFANQQRAMGKSLEEAIQEAGRLRLRPILMTTAAMVFGAIPLILSSGAGMEARRAIGFILVGGLTFGTCFTLLILPKLYHLIKMRTKSIKVP